MIAATNRTQNAGPFRSRRGSTTYPT